MGDKNNDAVKPGFSINDFVVNIDDINSLKTLWVQVQKIWGRRRSPERAVQKKQEILASYNKRIDEIASMTELQVGSEIYGELVKTLFVRGKLENMLINSNKAFEVGGKRSTFWAGGGDGPGSASGGFFNAFVDPKTGVRLSLPELLEKSTKYTIYGSDERKVTDEVVEKAVVEEAVDVVEESKEGIVETNYMDTIIDESGNTVKAVEGGITITNKDAETDTDTTYLESDGIKGKVLSDTPTNNKPQLLSLSGISALARAKGANLSPSLIKAVDRTALADQKLVEVRAKTKSRDDDAIKSRVDPNSASEKRRREADNDLVSRFIKDAAESKVALEEEIRLEEIRLVSISGVETPRLDLGPSSTPDGRGSGIDDSGRVSSVGVPIPNPTPPIPPSTTSNFKPSVNYNSGIVPPVNLPSAPPEFRETITPTANANIYSTSDMGTRSGNSGVPSLQSVLSDLDSSMTSKIANRRRNESSIKKLLEDINSFHKIYDTIIDGFKMSDEESKKINSSTDRKIILEHYEALELKISNYYRKDSGFKLGVVISADSLFDGSFFNQGSSDMSASSVNTPAGPDVDNMFTRGAGKEFKNIKVIQPTWTSGGVDHALGRPVQNHLVKTIPKSNIKKQKINLIQPASTKGAYNNILKRPSNMSVDWVIKTSKKN